MELNGCTVGPKPGSDSTVITHIRIQTRLNNLLEGVTIQEGVNRILAIASEYEDPKFDEETEYGYGDGDYQYLTVAGWRPMTPKELDDYQRAVKKNQADREFYDRSQLERLRREHPEWLKDELR